MSAAEAVLVTRLRYIRSKLKRSAVSEFEYRLIRAPVSLESHLRASMSNIQFKVSKPGGLIRRLAFPSKPSWQVLSSRIGELYDIPVDKIAVSYVDKDGDEVTLSSEEELQDFYDIEGSSESRAPIRFTIQDLRSLRDSGHDGSQSFQHSPRDNIRNTFGGVFDIDDDWQLPNLGFLRRQDMTGPDTPHAFLEVVESEVDVKSEPSELETVKAPPQDTSHPEIDKGKGKACEPSVTETISTTGSVLAEDAPPKPPIYVYSISPQKDQTDNVTSESTPLVSFTPENKDEPLPTESTPKAVVQSAINDNTAEAGTTQTTPPSIDTLTPPDTPSLSRDVASFIHALSTAISSHPELSDNIRNIVRNTANGAYWHTHRQNIAHAADEFARQAQATTGRAAEEVRRFTEEDAGRRVAEAVGELFRQLSTMTGGHTSRTITPPPDVAPPAAAPENSTTLPPTAAPKQRPVRLPPPPPPALPFGSRPNSWYGTPANPPVTSWGSIPTKPWEPGSGWRPWLAPRPPPRAIPPVPMTGWSHGPPPPPPAPPASNIPLYHPSVRVHQPPPPPPPPIGTYPDTFPDPATMTAEELRADLEVTKQRYKAEKELYRAQREERRKDKDRKRNWLADA